MTTKPETSQQESKTKIPGPISDEDLMNLVDAVLSEDDPFFVPKEFIPDGYSIEWKRKTVFGASAPNQASYEVNLARTYWTPVSLSEHPSFRPLVPENYDKNTVEKEGMMLYIRPSIVSEKVKEMQRIKADNQLGQKLAQVGQTGSGEAPRKVTHFNRTVAVPDKG